MIHNYDKEISVSFSGNLRWASGKIGKLYPLHIFMSLTALPLLIHRYIGHLYFGWNVISRITVNFLLIQSWFPWESVRYSLNNLSWFLSCLLFLYFIFPIFHQLIRKVDSNKKLISVIVVTWIGMWAYGWTANQICAAYGIDDSILKGITYNFPLYRAGDFFIGSLFGAMYVKGEKHKYSSNLYTILESAAVVIFIVMAVIDWEVFVCGGHEGYPWWKTAIYVFPAAFVVWTFSNTGGGICKALAKTPLTWLGDISGQVYLIHELVLIYLGSAMRWMLGSGNSGVWIIVKGILGFGMTLAAAGIWNKMQEFIRIRSKGGGNK